VTDGDGRSTDHSVVLEGKLNPAIFQPFWLASLSIIEPTEAEEAKPPLVSPEVALVRTARLSLQVTHERLVVKGRSNAASDRQLACEVAARLLQALPHTPISSMDMVHQIHLPAGLASWQSLAARLASSEAIGRLLPGGRLEEFRLDRREHDGALVTLVLEPSNKMDEGTYMRLHREYEAHDPDALGTAAWAEEMLKEHWAASVTFAGEITAAVESYVP
jgi:hypothetical protein